MTAQEIFNKVSAHLLTQGEKSMLIENNGRSICAYRNEKGQSCAIGCLISNDKYDKEMEKQSVRNFIYMEHPVFMELLPSDLYIVESREFLCDLQNCHDLDDVSYWPERLRKIAINFNLKEPV